MCVIWSGLITNVLLSFTKPIWSFYLRYARGRGYFTQGAVESVLTFATQFWLRSRPDPKAGCSRDTVFPSILRLMFEVSLKPIARLYGDLLQGPWLFKKMGRTRHDREL